MSKATKDKTSAELVLEVGLHYVGQNGGHLTGIPARDLSPQDVQALTKTQIEDCLDSGLYKIAHNKEEVTNE